MSYDDLECVHGARNISRVVRKPERQTRHLLETGKLPGAFKLNWGWSLHIPTYRAAIQERIAQAAAASRSAD